MKNKILLYEQFLNQGTLLETRRQLLINIFEQFEDVKPFMNEAVLFVNEGIFDMAFVEGEYLNEESIMAKMKDKFANAVNIVKQKGKQALTDTQETILQLGGKIANVIKLLVSKLAEWVKSALSAAQSTFKNAVASSRDKIADKIEKIDDKHLLIDEVKKLKAISVSTVKWLQGGLVNQVAKAADVATKEDGSNEAFEIALLISINESIKNGDLDFTDILESGGIPFVSAIAHKMHHIPPFNLLDKVKQAAEKVAGGALNRFSIYATKLAGAPGPYEFVAMAAIIGIIAEVQVKGIAKHAILTAVPGLGTILSIISNVAMALAVIGIVEALIKGKDDKEHAH